MFFRVTLAILLNYDGHEILQLPASRGTGKMSDALQHVSTMLHR